MNNLERMLALVESAFYDREDSAGQITVDEQEREKLLALSPYSLTEYNEGDGPAIWLLLVPTTLQLMNEFIAGNIDEVTLLNQTPVSITYEALYLCSAITLPEYRSKRLTFKLAVEAISGIQASHQLRWLFYWPFSEAGEKLALRISEELNLPLRKRID